ncbi:hypothetical protein CCP2SC5_820003 [Azospirillaceae bacterium]
MQKHRPELCPGPAKGREVFGNHDLETYNNRSAKAVSVRQSRQVLSKVLIEQSL